MAKSKIKNHNNTKETQQAKLDAWQQGMEVLDNLQRISEGVSDDSVPQGPSPSFWQRFVKGVRNAVCNARAFVKRVASQVWSFLLTVWRKKDVIGDVIKNKHRFVVMDSQTYKEKISFQLTGINLFVVLGVSMIVLVILTTLIIAFTPLREFIPGYTSTKMTEQTFQNAVVIDSLEREMVKQEQMLSDIKAIMMGQNPEELRKQRAGADASAETDSVAPGKYTHSKADSLLRVEVESADKYSLRSPAKKPDSKEGVDRAAVSATPVSMQLFFTPMKGKVISGYDPKIKHYGVDIAGATNEVVKSVMSGTVLMSDFTVETGYVIVIQHPGSYVSMYKHNSSLLKRVGDVVRAGEPIAYLGNSGELTSGPHLHFELWSSGKPVNPLQYISF